MTINKSKFSIALGSVFVATMAASPVASAAQNPFMMASLESGYMVAAADKAKEGKCGEGKCGAGMNDKAKMKDGSCGAANGKMKEGTCGASSTAAPKMKDGKCGEGKCGATKK